MPSFDLVSKINAHELTNAVDQANREVKNRFDFKGSNSRFELSDDKITLITTSDFQLKQMMDILKTKLVKRKIDLRALKEEKPDITLHQARKIVNLQQGIDKENAKKITKLVKEAKLKVQASIQGSEVRISGKKRDDLQSIMALIREQRLGIAIQFENFRD